MALYSIVLIPERNKAGIEALRAKAAALAGERRMIPIHISIRETFETQTVEKLKKELLKAAGRFGAFRIRFKCFTVLQKHVVLEVVKTKKLQKLHESVLAIVDKFRTDYVRPEYAQQKSISEKQREYIKLHGYPYCKEYYLPHLTLVYNAKPKGIRKVKAFLSEQKIPKSETIRKLILLKKEGNSWVVEKKMGFNG